MKHTVIALLLVLSALPANAGGPAFVTGVSDFDPSGKGMPLTWAQGSVSYYTDQGNLSPALPGTSANALVADAFSRWTSIPTAAVAAIQSGQLGEDVNGSNVFANSDGTITLPADILPTAVATPLAIVYDSDGIVTDALLGQGASASLYCYANASFGGPDNFTADGHFAHALIVLNGQCVQTSSQLFDFEYRLIRVLGHTLGLDWAQLNVNVQAGNPSPSSADYAGFPLMHATDLAACVPISKCYPNADQPKMDDQAALSRLYPVTTQNIASFSGKQLFPQTTGRIHGSVYFSDTGGNTAQPMQGVNVVARWIDPSTGQPSRTVAASCVSGFLFRGNAGNPATGFDDSTGQSFDRFGSDDASVEGFFDFAGLQIPNGATSTQYQLTVEALSPQWSQNVGPYAPLQVEPSGTAQPIVVTVNLGGDVQQDILMSSSAHYASDFFEPTTYAAPVPVPAAGDWIGSFGNYGNVDYFWLSGQANRTLSVEVTALNEAGVALQSKAQPVIGMWGLADPGSFPAPANTPSAFNTVILGETRLDATLLQPTTFRIAIADYRGDGRPDYRYHARVFYGDSITPSRASVAGGTPLTVQGLGFRLNTAVGISNTNAPPLVSSANAILISAPAMKDGVADIVLRDPATGASSTLTGALVYGAGPSDTLKLIAGTNPATPAGGQAPNPIVFQVLAADGVTPVAGASVALSAAPAVGFSACGAASTCTVLTDAGGLVSTYATVVTAGTITITARLAPNSYTNPKSAVTTLLGTASSLDISLTPAFAWIAGGATIDIPISARVLANGSPLSGRTVNYQILKGTGSLSAVSPSTDANGNAATTLHLASLSGDVLVSACVAPSNAPCQNLAITAVPIASLRLQAVSGLTQEILASQNFQPLTVRVMDNSTPPHPVAGANVIFRSAVERVPNGRPVVWFGDTGIQQPVAPVILATSQVTIASDSNGLASFQPSSAGVAGPVVIVGSALAGSMGLPFQLQSFPAPSAATGMQVRSPALRPPMQRTRQEESQKR